MNSASVSQQRNILFLGDCNTLGTPDIEGKAYPERATFESPALAINCGHTMTTTREGSRYFSARFNEEIDVICIQYGLVDSWKTFKFSPYVLYYPDSKRRKIARKLVKKFKKWCKRLGLNALIGEKNVVPIDEYRNIITEIITQAAPKPVILIETVPNKDQSRNAEIQRYNAALKTLASLHTQCFLLPLYDDFNGPMQDHYSDPTHLSELGHEYVAQKLKRLLNESIFSGKYES